MKTHYINPTKKTGFIQALLNAKRLITCFVFLTLFSASSFAQLIDSYGEEFWIAFMSNYPNPTKIPTLQLFIASKDGANVQIDIASNSFSTNVTVSAGELVAVEVPLSTMISDDNLIQNKGIHVVSDSEVIIYGLNQQTHSTDAYLAIPLDALGTEHYIMSYRSNSSDNRSQFALVAAEDGTEITIRSPVSIHGNPANTPFTITLNQGETIQYKAGTNEEVTGTFVSSDKPIGVFGGNPCADVPNFTQACDHLVEMIPSTDKWGQAFVTVPFAERLHGDRFKVMASEANTTYMVNGVPGTLAAPGDYIEFVLEDASSITSDKPILLVQFMQGSEVDGTRFPGDPAMIILAPTEQFLGDYIVSTPATGFTTHHINLVARTSSISSIIMDGASVDPTLFSQVTGTLYSVAQVPVSRGVHSISGQAAFGISIYGVNAYDSYAYTGGQVYSSITHVNSLTLNPDESFGQIGSDQCVVASLKTTDGNPVSGARVDFAVTGVNSTSGFAFTNSQGKASFCYSGTNIGQDEVVATQGTLDVDVIVNWLVGEYSCFDLSANIGDPCELEVGVGQISADCECMGIDIPDCEFVYYLSDHAAADGLADIFEVTLLGGIATMNHIAQSNIEVHIAYHADQKLIYAISKNENSYRTLDPATADWGPEVLLGDDYGEITAAVFNHDGKLLIGSQSHKKIYSVNVTTNEVSTYDTYAPLYGGDLAFRSDGMLYMATRSGNGLYKVWSEPEFDELVGILPPRVTGMAITDADQLLISAHGNTNLILRNTNGDDPGVSFDLMLDGELYTLRDGDMASGCNPSPPDEGPCSDFTTFLVNHGEGIVGSDIYTVKFSGENANLTFLTNVTYETHIAFDAVTNILYLVNVDGSFVRRYDVSLTAFLGDMPLIGDFDKLTAAVFNPTDELLYVGDHVQNKIYTIDPETGISAFYADAPVSGGDLEILDGGILYLGTKDGSALYKIEGGGAVLVGGMEPNVTGMARANDEDDSFIISNNGATVLSKIDAFDGSTIKTYQIMLNGAPFTLTDGDMAAGCADPNPTDEPEPGKCHATQIVEYIQGTSKSGGAIAANRTDPTQALGEPERVDALVFVSLGYGGSLILGFDGAVLNGPDADLEIVETSYGNPTCEAYPEYADISVSVDGLEWHFAKTVCRTDGFVDISDAGDFDHIYFVKIENHNTLSTTPDGFDVDGVVAIHNCIPEDVTPPISPLTVVESISTLTSYPNPTKGSSKVVFVTSETTRTLVEVYDMNGRNVATLFNREAQQGEEYKLDFNGGNLPNGVYIYRMTTNNETIIDKFMIAR